MRRIVTLIPGRGLTVAALVAASLAAGLHAGAQAAPARQTTPRVVVVGYPDLAGNGPAAPGCTGCDLSFTNGDTLAQASNPLPLLEIVLKDAQGAELQRKMTSALSDGRRPTSFDVSAPGTFTVEVAQVPTDWEVCTNDSASKTVTAADFDVDQRVQVDFYFWRGCSIATATATATGGPTSPATATSPGPTSSAPAATPTAGGLPTIPPPLPTATSSGGAPRPGASSGGTTTQEDREVRDEPPPALGGGSGEIRGLVYIDLNQDGALGRVEPGLGPVAVRLRGMGRQAEITTPIAGTFNFANLPDGAYDISVEVPVGYRLTTTGRYDAVAVTGETVMGIDFGLFPEAGLQSLRVPPQSVPPPRFPSTGADPVGGAPLLIGLVALAGLLAILGLAVERRPGWRS
ncbi:MAG: SdrD B-like domain-containing protein [Anaerolineae bacterium]